MARLLLLTSSFPRHSGDFAGSFVFDFADTLSSDFDIEILSPASKGAPAEETRGRLKIHRFNYLWPRSFQLLDAAADLQPLLERSLTARLQVLPFFIIFFLRTLLMARRADIICSHWLAPAGLAGSLAARLLGKPHIVIEHSGALHLLRKIRFGRMAARLIARCSMKIVVVSSHLREQFVALCPEAASKIEIIPMGVKLERSKEHKLSKKRVLFLGRLVPVKGVNILLDALAGCSDLQLIIAGDGEQREELERRALSLNVPAQFIGPVAGETKRSLLRDCDLVVIPSIILPDGRTEGLPVVCLEAFAAGKAVIASAAGGLRELIVDGETGLLFEPGNSAELRKMIFSLLHDDERRRAIGDNAFKIVTEYDWSRIASRYRKILLATERTEETERKHLCSQ